MTSEQVPTEQVPTEQVPTEQVPTEPMLTERQTQLLTFLAQHYMLTGELMSEQKAKDEFYVSTLLYQSCMTNETFRSALAERGVVVRRAIDPLVKEEDQWTRNSLTPVQLVVANTMLDLVDTRSQKKKLQDMNISTAQYAAWLKDPVFYDYLRQRSELMLGENQHEAHLALLDKVRAGDVKAIELYNEMTGRFTRQTSQNQGSSVAVDVQAVLIRVLEIIGDTVSNPEEILIISDKLKTMMVARAITGALLEPEPIVQPIVAPARELTPKLQALMDKGIGNE